MLACCGVLGSPSLATKKSLLFFGLWLLIWGFLALWFDAFVVLWFYGFLVVWFYGNMVLWLCGCMVLWFPGFLVSRIYQTSISCFQEDTDLISEIFKIEPDRRVCSAPVFSKNVNKRISKL